MYTPFWYNQPNILIDKNSLFEIFPVKEYDTVRKLNAVLRFSIYYTIIVFMYNRNTNIFAVPLITALVTFFIHKNNSSIQVNNLDTQLRNDIINNEIAIASNFKRDAKSEKSLGTATNVGALLFWLPGMVATQMNANEAIRAADDRINHLNRLKAKKSC